MTTSLAIAHDFLAGHGGGERVAAVLAAGFPEATVHTLIHRPSSTFAGCTPSRVSTSWLDRIPPLANRYRATLPLAAPTWAATRIDADVTICSTSGLSHHVRTTGARIVYCHTPARWIHDADRYLDGFGRSTGAAARTIRPLYRRWDIAAMRSADLVVANSHQIAHEIHEVYGICADVIPPASALEIHGPVSPIPDVRPGFFLAPMRALGYKRLDVLVAAARRRPDQTFLHIGGGPNAEELRAAAPPNLVSVGTVDDAQLRWAYRNATAAVMTAAEDFGLVPLEAAAHGLMTIAPDARGVRDHDPDWVATYPYTSVDGLLDLIDTIPAPLRVIDEKPLGVERFITAITNLVDEVRRP